MSYHTDPAPPAPPTIDQAPIEPPPYRARIDPDPDPVPPWPTPCATCGGEGDCPDCQTLCPNCQNSGSFCLDCGALDMPAIGRKVKHLLHHDTNAFIDILNGTQRRFWPLFAHAYALAVGVVNDAEAERVVVKLWADLVAA